MTDDIWHGLVVIGSAMLLLIYLPLLVKQVQKNGVRGWWSSQPLLVALGWSVESAGVLTISAYRAVQIYFTHSAGLTNAVTSAALALIFIGGVIMVRAATLDHAHWKWRLLWGLVFCWLVFAFMYQT